jgi:hypothetical protein
MSEEAEQNFDWGDLGEDEWRALGKKSGVTELQLRWAVAFDSGCSATEAASLAGYQGSREILKSSGYGAKNAPDVIELLDKVERRRAELAHGLPAEPGWKERKKILGKQARSKDAKISQFAIAKLNQMDEVEARLRIEALENVPEPGSILKDIESVSPLTAIFLAHVSGAAAHYGLYEQISDASIASLKTFVANLEMRKANPSWDLPQDLLFEGGKNGTTQSTAGPINGDIVGRDFEGPSEWESEQQAG